MLTIWQVSHMNPIILHMPCWIIKKSTYDFCLVEINMIAYRLRMESLKAILQVKNMVTFLRNARVVNVIKTTVKFRRKAIGAMKKTAFKYLLLLSQHL